MQEASGDKIFWKGAEIMCDRQECARIQPPFSVIPDPDQNKEDASFTSVVAYDVFILLSHPIQFCPLPNQKFEKNAQDSADPAKPCIQDPSGFLPILMRFKSYHFIKEIACHIQIITWTIRSNSPNYRRSCFARIDV